MTLRGLCFDNLSLGLMNTCLYEFKRKSISTQCGIFPTSWNLSPVASTQYSEKKKVGSGLSPDLRSINSSQYHTVAGPLRFLVR